MSEFELFNLDSNVIYSSAEKKKSTAISSRGGEDKVVPVHLFLNDESASPASSSSISSKTKDKTVSKPLAKKKRSKKEKKQTRGKQDQKNNSVISPVSDYSNFSSSDSEYVFSSESKGEKSQTFFKLKKPLRLNKVKDTVKESRKVESQNVKIDKNKSIHIEEHKDEESLSADYSSVGAEIKKIGTSASELSYRERIRDRFNVMKEQITESLSKNQCRSQSRLKIPTTRQPGPKSEDLMKEEEAEVSAAMERHKRAKLRWRQISKLSIKQEFKNQSECKNFFEGKKNQTVSRTVQEEEKISKNSSDFEKAASEEPKMLASELLDIKEDWELIEHMNPKMEKNKNKLLWSNHLFFSSAKPVSLQDKIEPGLKPIFKEKEGLYEGNRGNISSKMKNRMEQRILKTPDGRKWFGKDGNLIPSNCLLKPILTRPFYSEDTVQINFKSATPGNITHQYLDLSVNLNYVLDIDFNSIEFTHHPLFSREHVVSQRLKELFVKYKKRKQGDNLNRITSRLNALRKTRDNLKLILGQCGDNQNLRDKLRKYQNDIKEAREVRYSEGQIDKQIANKLVTTWKDLLKLREEQGYQNNSLILNVQKIPKDSNKDNDNWEVDMKQEIEEIYEELKAEYETAMNNYEDKYKLWSQIHQKKKEKKIKNQDLTVKLSDTESENESESDLSEFSIEKPVPPKSVIIEDIKAQVFKNYKESFRQPGEPELEFFLYKKTNLDKSVQNVKEELRRAAVKRCQIFLKLFYNGKEVCRSKSGTLKQNFTVDITQRFAIRILEWPESLMIEIHEEAGPLNRNLLVPGIYLPFPDPFSTVQNSETLKHEFSSNFSVTYHHAAVGSGNNIIPCPKGSDFNNQPVCLFTAGTISYRIGWGIDNGKILSPPEKYWSRKKYWGNLPTNLSEIIKSGGAFDVSKLKEWAESSKLDPNDPHNSVFFYFLKTAGDLEKKTSYFRLNPLAEEFTFCRDSDVDSNIRLELLRLRNMEEPEFREIRMIPLNSKEIPKEMLKDYKKRLSSPQNLTDILSSDLFDGHRAWGKRYLEQVQQNLLKKCRKSRKNKRFQDIITEETIPDVGTLGLSFMQWLRPKRPLRPIRKERKKITPQNLSSQEVNIVVNVVRAFEVPVRKDCDVLPGNESFEGFSLVNVRPFVEISFKGIKAKTTAAEGANPTWNQDLRIPVKTKSGYFSPGDLQSIKNTLYLHLFDEIVIDLVEEESSRETNIHQRLEKHWLASMEIPFSTLYFNSKIEGTFKLYSPPVLLGYEREAHRNHYGAVNGQESSVPQRDATYITLFVTVEPPLNLPKPVEEKIESRESSDLQKYLEDWQQEIKNIFPNRKVKALVLDITGKSVCVTRFIKPLPLPPILPEDKTTPEMAARLVAMIPTTTKSTTFPRFFDIWLTCDQTLKLICGDPDDHAILLCSYFLQLGFQAFVLIGTGIPHGSMAYVLVKEKGSKRNEYFIWDPTNGQKYSADDSFCPLQKVYCLINDQNVWANIQAEEIPRRIRFDLTKSSDWFPAFRKNMTAPTESIQPSTLEYKTTSRQAVDILRDKIEKKLRDNIMKWRRKNRTQWNRYCAVTLRKLLPKLEESMWNSEKNSPDHIVELQHILASHKMCGFPINMAYTGTEAVSEAVKATGVHCNETEGTEFALAVYIHPYPNNILSVWVYVASLVRRR